LGCIIHGEKLLLLPHAIQENSSNSCFTPFVMPPLAIAYPNINPNFVVACNKDFFSNNLMMEK
jgi:hypothetical protein